MPFTLNITEVELLRSEWGAHKLWVAGAAL